jgi:hypothetical protein
MGIQPHATADYTEAIGLFLTGNRASGDETRGRAGYWDIHYQGVTP